MLAHWVVGKEDKVPRGAETRISQLLNCGFKLIQQKWNSLQNKAHTLKYSGQIYFLFFRFACTSKKLNDVNNITFCNKILIVSGPM